MSITLGLGDGAGVGGGGGGEVWGGKSALPTSVHGYHRGVMGATGGVPGGVAGLPRVLCQLPERRPRAMVVIPNSRLFRAKSE